MRNDRAFKTHLLLSLFFLLAILGACTPAPVPLTPEPSKPSSPTVTATPSPTQAASLSRQGPWLALFFDYGLWVMNPDGTAFTQLAYHPDHSNMIIHAIAPGGGRIAFVDGSIAPDRFIATPPMLELVTLPSTSPQALTLLGSGKKLPASPGENDPNREVSTAVIRDNSLAWSRDGARLAFIGAQDGPSADLYTYSILDQTITRLSSGLTQSINPRWSPDGRYVVSAGASSINWGLGGGNGPTLASIWAERPDGSDLHLVYTYPDHFNGQPTLLGWVNDQAYIEYYSVIGCGEQDLTFVDISTSIQATILPGPFSRADLDPVTGTLLVLIDNSPAFGLCSSSLEPGLYLISAFANQPLRQIPYKSVESSQQDVNHRNDQLITWSPEAQRFFISLMNGVFIVDLNGQGTSLEIPGSTLDFWIPKISPDGQDWALSGKSGLWIASSKRSPKQVYNGAVDNVLWTPDGSAVLFLTQGFLPAESSTPSFSLYRAAGPDYQPVAIGGPWKARGIEMDWVMP